IWKLVGVTDVLHDGGGGGGVGGGGGGDGEGEGDGAGDGAGPGDGAGAGAGAGPGPGAGEGAGDGAGWPACVSTTRASFSRTSPCRGDAAGLATTRSATCPLPCPDAGERSVIQPAWAAAVHPHSGSALTLRFTTPPVASTG